MFSQSRVNVSASLANLRSLAVRAFDVVNCSLSVVGLIPVSSAVIFAFTRIFESLSNSVNKAWTYICSKRPVPFSRAPTSLNGRECIFVGLHFA